MSEPRRERVVHPRTDAASRVPPRATGRPGGGVTPADEIYIRSLISGQARIAALVVAATAILLGGVALAGAFWPAAGRAKLAGVPVTWLVLAVLIYPVLMALGRFAVRQVERNEDAYRALTTRR